jgi:alpha-D-xyloside xylohydrolase
MKDGIVVYLGEDAINKNQSVRLQVINDKVIHVTAVPGKSFPAIKSLIAVDLKGNKPSFKAENVKGYAILHTGILDAIVSLRTGEVVFHDKEGKIILAEKQGGGKSFDTVTIQNKQYLKVRQQFESPMSEAIYGLGANQTSFMNLKGKDADLYEYNTLATIPFIISNKNYGILWDNYSRTKFGDVNEYKELSSLKLYNKDGVEGGLTATYSLRNDKNKILSTREEKEINYQFIPDLAKFPKGYSLMDAFVTWEGSMECDSDGLYKFLFTSAGYSKLWVDGNLVFDRWRQCWNPSSNRFDLPMERGKKYTVKIEWTPDGVESFIAFKYLDPLPQTEQNRISFSSEVADKIDYYFISGSSMDNVISGYRTVTGKAPMMPKWAMGFWQSRQRYKTQDEILSVVTEFRNRQIPLDNIVLDWQYWPVDKWGDHNFDPDRFKDPDAMIKELHEQLHTNIMISVWAKYYVGTENYDRMNAKGWLYKYNIDKNRKDWMGYVSTFYDAYNADAREDFWNQINTKLFSKGIDAWWLDATEPDICSNLPMDERKALMNPTALGPSDKYFNAFSLMQSKGVYEGQIKTSPNQRVFILTRSAFAGLQRYSAANWSGDIAARWHDMKAQIPCGLNFSMSGIPYWTMDIGGFAVETRYQDAKGADLDEWRELMTRWYQFGAFCPVFRSHGEYPYREMFNIAPETTPAYQAMLSYDRLRYRLMPYIYSLAGETWLNDYTIMRGLVMDFGEDNAVNNIADQFMFGPSLLVCPVTEYKARNRSVYLPKTCGWYNLFTGIRFEGGQTIIADAPLENIPVFVKEGSIIPFGPAIQYTSEKPADPLTLYVYTGANGSFTLYEDEGLTNEYLKGAYSLIKLSYTESDHTLTLGARQGRFEGMLQSRTFMVVVVSKDKPAALSFDTTPYKEVVYDGNEQNIAL